MASRDSEARQSFVEQNGSASSTSRDHLPISYAFSEPQKTHVGGRHAGAHPTKDPRNEDAQPDGALTAVAELPGRPAQAASPVSPMEIQEALLPPRPPAPFVHPLTIGQRRWMVFMFCLVSALLFADQNLLAPNLTAAADYFHMSERQKDTLLGGALMGAFFLVGAPAALVVGWLSDRGDINRRNLLFAVVVIGEMPCLLTYWVTRFWQFFVLRALTGIAVGGCFPLVFSLLGDLFPPERRAAVSAVVQIATGAGLAAGQALSGAIGPATNWRVPFVVVAAPSLLMALLMLLTTREPPRGAFEEALRDTYAEGGAYSEKISWAKVSRLLRVPSNVLIVLQGLPGSLPWGMILSYFNDFLSQNKGLSVQTATLVLLMYGGGGALGVIAGGALGQWLYNRVKEYQALLAGACVLAGIGPLYAIINADLKQMGLGVACFLSFLGGAVASVAGPNLRAVMLNVNEPETRGVALALQSMTDDLGKGLGPVMVAGLINVLGRKGAFNVATGGWIPCSFMLAALALCMRRDEEAMQRRIAGRVEAAAAAAENAARGEGGVQMPYGIGDADGSLNGGGGFAPLPVVRLPGSTGDGSFGHPPSLRRASSSSQPASRIGSGDVSSMSGPYGPPGAPGAQVGLTAWGSGGVPANGPAATQGSAAVYRSVPASDRARLLAVNASHLSDSTAPSSSHAAPPGPGWGASYSSSAPQSHGDRASSSHGAGLGGQLSGPGPGPGGHVGDGDAGAAKLLDAATSSTPTAAAGGAAGQAVAATVPLHGGAAAGSAPTPDAERVGLISAAPGETGSSSSAVAWNQPTASALPPPQAPEPHRPQHLLPPPYVPPQLQAHPQCLAPGASVGLAAEQDLAQAGLGASASTATGTVHDDGGSKPSHPAVRLARSEER